MKNVTIDLRKEIPELFNSIESQIQEIEIEVVNNVRKYQQYTIDACVDIAIFFKQCHPLFIDIPFSAYDIDLVLGVFNPEFKKDIDVLKKILSLLELLENEVKNKK